MRSTEVQRTFPLPLERTWDLLTAFEHYPGRIDSYEALEFENDQRSGIGARWRQTRTVFGRSHSQRITVTGWESSRVLTLQAHEAGARYETRYELVTVSNETEVTMTFSVAATNPLAWLFIQMFGRRLLRSTGEAIRRDLDDLAASHTA